MITEQLARYVSGLSIADLPEEVVARSKLLLLDFIAVTIGGRYQAETTRHLVETAETLGWRDGRATVLGLSTDFAPPAAALINGALAHSLEFDDTHAAASLHPSATVIPAALAAGEIVDVDGSDLIAAIVAGYELSCRVAKALVPSEHYARGFHPTATAGTFGAATAAARVFGLTPEGVASALGLAGSQAAGSMQFMDNGAWNKRFHVGAAAQNGLVAATLARQGYLGASAAIEGKNGFLSAYAPNPQPELAVAALGEHYETLSIALKPYPACRLVHAAIDAILDLRRQYNIAAGQVERVEIGLSQLALDITGHPEALKRHPRNLIESQFSMHICAAIALQRGSVGWSDFQQLWQDADTLQLCERVAVYHDADVQADYPGRLSGRVRITVAGTTHEAKVDTPRGEPERFLSPGEIGDKFAGLVGDAVSSDQVAEITGLVMRAEHLKSARDLTQATLPPAADRANRQPDHSKSSHTRPAAAAE